MKKKTETPKAEAPKPVQIFTSKAADTKTERAKTVDGFVNFTARLGLNNDNQLSQGFYSFNLITRNRVQLEAAYRGSWISRKLIDIPAEDMTRAGVEITTNDAAEKLQDFNAAISKYQIWQSLADVIKWGGLYGGAIGVMQIRGAKLDTPLDPDTIGKDQFQGIAVYDRWQLNPDLTDVIDSGPEIGLPKYYWIITTSVASNVDPASTDGMIKVHYSRCIRMGGQKLPFFQAIEEMMWDESNLEVLWDRLISFDTAAMSAAGLITRANLRTISVEGLREILAAGGPAQEALEAMFEMMRMMQNSEGISLLDKADAFTATSYTFAGLSDLLLQFAQHLSGATDIPLIRLFSQSPTGMNATGDSDLRLYYDGINSKQNAKLRNPLLMIIRVMWCSMYGELPPKDLDFTFASLWQMTPVDKATVSKSNAETIIGAHDAGLTKKATTLKELRQDSRKTGLFSNITDEEIEEAEEEDENPPMPEMDPSTEKESADPDADKNAEKPPKLPKLSSDSAWRKIKKWLARDADFKEDDHPGAKNGEFGKGGGSGSKGKKSLKKQNSNSVKVDYSPNEQNALAHYTGTAYAAVGHMLMGRENKVQEDQRPVIKSIISDIDSAMKKSTTSKPMTVYRGMTNVPTLAAYTDKNVGEEISSQTFWSSSTEKDKAERFVKGQNAVMMEIKIPEGSRAIDMKDYERAPEGEQLLDRNQKYKIVSVKKERNLTVLKMELVKDE